EAGLRRLLRVRLEVIDAADAREQLELQARIVAQKLADLHQVLRLDHYERVDGVELLGLDAVAEFGFEGLGDVRGGHGMGHTPGIYALVGAAFSLFRLANSFAFSSALSGSGSANSGGSWA